MRNRKKDIVLALIFTVFIISFAVVVTVFFKQLYYFDIGYLDIAKDTGLSVEVIKKNYDVLIEYQSLFYSGVLELPDFIMSATGRIHFEEVKRVFEIVQITCLVSGIISVIMIFFNIKEKEYRFLRLTSFFTVGIPTVLGFFVALDFDRAFVIFHNIVFRNEYWIFDYRSDPVITILPKAFFMHCFMLIIFIVVIISIGCYLLYKRKEKAVLEHV